jgi:hypothetical protein
MKNRGVEKLVNDEPHNLYASSNIIRMIKYRRMRWAGNAAHIPAIRNCIKY